ncbi:cytochrome b [Pseudomonas sp. S2_B10]|jgi:cytochrome b561
MKTNSVTHSPRRFNLLARILHWSMALAIIAMLFIGVGMMTSLTWRPFLINWHQSLGAAILCLASIRLFNRLLHPGPLLPKSVPKWQATAARVTHWLLYFFMFSLPLFGWAMRSAGNWPITILPGWNVPAIVGENPVVYAWCRMLHGAFAWLFFVAILGHISAALLHAWVYKDKVFATMMFVLKRES